MSKYNFISRAQYVWNKVIRFNLDKKILDCASGDGHQTTQQWIQWGLKPENITAIDVSKKDLDILNKMGVKTIEMDLEKRSILEELCNKKFDIMVCTETIEHLQKNTTDKLFKDFMEILETNGCLVVTYPSKAYPGKSKIPFGHIRQPNDKEIEDILGSYFNRLYIDKFAIEWKHRRRPARFLLFEGKKI